MGVAVWIRKQMSPSTLDDSNVDCALAAMPTLALSVADLRSEYPKRRAREITQELVAQKLIRAVSSERQLQEVLVDFWFNHFNVDGAKGQDRWMISAYERDAIRPHVFGKFRELLGATAHHPAMLFYLDNWLSVREGAKPAGKKPARGLNENYGRELLELHTLGVDSGYSQDDVRETARAFTGWSFGRDDGSFVFHPKVHDGGTKKVLGQAIDDGGERDGEHVLDLVAKSPATARFVAEKLCRKFVSDTPPAALVSRVAATFTRTDGDLSAVYGEIFESPELWSKNAMRAKVKTPLELVVSAMRAVGATVDRSAAVARVLETLGEPLYRCAPPTGFAEESRAWVSSGALVTRINFGLDLAAGRVPGVRFDREALLGTEALHEDASDAVALVDALAMRVLHAPLSSATRAALVSEVADTDERQRAVRALGLLLGSPEFQKQ